VGAVLHAFSIPLAVPFRGLTQRRGLVFAGSSGWAEFSPFEEYSPVESVPWWRAAQEAAEQGFPPPVRSRVPVNAIIPAVGPELVPGLLALARGCTTAKVKVAQRGQSVTQELDRVAAVRDVLGPKGRIRIDANGAWDFDTAVERIRVLDHAAGGLEYAEQPCADAADLARIRRQVDVPIAADESIRRASDPFRVKALEAADLVVLKVQPLGGVRACLHLAAELDLPVVVSSAVETSVGLAAGLALAAALPDLDYACGLGTLTLLEGDLVESGQVTVKSSGWLASTLPAPPTPQLLDRYSAPPMVRERWLAHWDQTRRLAETAT
ncbi:MAG: o-succinylbenzoate synthase, partial [Bifidobacteriaceae bacterium]|nr:o-succinylbenzoate synthase [Bifidobacteriaceae bacterium]